jgi:hypothetical protein
MIVSINQPAYLPWLGYFERIAASDLHIVLDHVQYEKNSYTNRNKVRTKEGWCWLTVPLKTKGKFGDLAINKVEIDNGSKWADKHWKTIQSNYTRAPFFSDHKLFFEEVYSCEWLFLSELLREITTYLLSAFEIKTPIVFSSEMKSAGVKDELVINLCREVGATCYISGALGRQYLREEIFSENAIKVIYQDYKHPSYAQAFPGFEPFMAAVDLLFDSGPASRKILMTS